MQALREKCLRVAKERVADSVDADDLIKRAISMHDALQEHTSPLTASLREWYGLYVPEVAKRVDPEAVPDLTRQPRENVLESFDVEGTMGGDFSDEDTEMLRETGRVLEELQRLQTELQEYIESTMDEHCWNTLQVAGGLVGARLLAQAGSLRELAMMPSGKIQVLGAEEALFRHIRTGAKPPRFGHLFHHPLVQSADEEERGKVARNIADKLAIATRADYFGEKEIGAELRDKLEEEHG